MPDKLDILLTALTEFRSDFEEYKKENKVQFEEYKKENKVQFEEYKKENKVQFEKYKKENKEQFDQFKTQLTRVEATLIRLEENQSQDIVAVLKQIDKKLDDRDNELKVLNKRLFKNESDVERLTRQLEY
ncbi:hypothetical protein ACQCU1_18605 [Sutcliffiella horikoshii]|uniref:hypothetical protein n=1 Tax=Sutcliffiella horikoshii TaxID=79883 RepID=UPI003CF8EB54